MKWSLLPLLVMCACGDKSTDTATNTDTATSTDDTATTAIVEPSTDPGQSPEELGKELYDAKCASCHGADGKGGSGPNILNASESKFYRVIQNGDGPMPAFPELSDTDIDNIIAYVQSL